jgi:hypothetical protein
LEAHGDAAFVGLVVVGKLFEQELAVGTEEMSVSSRRVKPTELAAAVTTRSPA